MTLVTSGSALVCACKDGYKQLTSTRLDTTKCLLNTHATILNAKFTLSSAISLTFDSFSAQETGNSDTQVTLASALFQDVFMLTASECYFYQSAKQTRYCQLLGNLCVLQHFHPSAPSCALLSLIQISGRTTTANGISGWYYTLPFLNYGDDASRVMQSTNIAMKVYLLDTR